LNGAKLYQFAAANSPRGGVAGLSLPMAVWSPLSRSLWALRRLDAAWVASCHGLPISVDFSLRNLDVMRDTLPPSNQLTILEQETALRELCISFTWPLDDWSLGLIPTALSRILSTLGLGSPDTWRQAVMALRDYWNLVSRDRRAPSTLDDDARLERRTSRQRRYRGQVAATLLVTEAEIIDRPARRYGDDRGRPIRL
jgi:hypothetical protein